MDRDDGAVQRDSFELHADDRSLLQLGKDASEPAALRPPVHARLARVPVPEPLGSAARCAALFGDVPACVEYLQIVECDVAALGRLAAFDVTILCLGEFHVRSIA